MTFNEQNVNRDQDGKFGEKTGLPPVVSLDRSVVLDNGWRSIRQTERMQQLSAISKTDKALVNPDCTAEFTIGTDVDRVNITMTDLETGNEASAWLANDDDELAEAGYTRGNLVFDSEDEYDLFAKYSERDPEFIDAEARQVRDHNPAFREGRTFAAHNILPGDRIDMEPVLDWLEDHGHYDADPENSDRMLAESELFVVESVERETPGTVVIYSDGGNYAIPADLRVEVSSHESLNEGNPSAYPGESDFQD